MLMEKAQRDVYGRANAAKMPDIVRKDMMLHFGAFITESSGHLSEYLPYYRKRPELIEKYAAVGLRRHGFVLRRQLAELAQIRRREPHEDAARRESTWKRPARGSTAPGSSKRAKKTSRIASTATS